MIETLKSVFDSFEPRILFAYVFGSAGTASQHRNSDLDVAVYLDAEPSSITLDHKHFLYAELARATMRNDIDVVILNTCTNLMLIYDVMTNGRLIFEIDFDARILFEQKALHAAIDFKEQRERIMA
ncbi:MAG: nucleotidyltransferase domain-containing protein [Desulfobacteraceae bacterium]|jgi:predicted nucleotidyltransferase|nr:nucleotidyltransferase domain-containing protein [Desulfobacteraceae bacterium]